MRKEKKPHRKISIPGEVVEQCLDAFEFEQMTEHMNRHGLTPKMYQKDDTPMSSLAGYRWVRDAVRDIMGLFVYDDEETLKKIRERFHCNCYVEDGFLICEFDMVTREGWETETEYIGFDSLHIQFRDLPGDDAEIRIRYVLASQIY